MLTVGVFALDGTRPVAVYSLSGGVTALIGISHWMLGMMLIG
jgi:hypothetical protein